MTGLPHLKIALFSLTTLLALTACEQAGETPTAPTAPLGRIQRQQGAYDLSSLSPSLFVGGRRPAERRAPLLFQRAPFESQSAKKKPKGKPSPLANGSFELNGGLSTNQFTDWTVFDTTVFSGSWLVQQGSGSPLNGFTVGSPTDGDFAAMTDQFGPGLHILYQDVQVPPHGQAILSFDLYLNNLAGAFFTPGTLSPDEFPNQQFRVDIVDPSAPLDDVAGVLLPVYRTEEGDSATVPYRNVSVSLKQFAGRTVRIRFAEVDNQFFFLVGLDRVQLGHKPRSLKAPKVAGRATANAIPFAPEAGPFPNVLTLDDDQTTGPLPIGFEFEFFGVRYSQFNVSSNGFVSFDADAPNGCCGGGVIPSDDGLNNLIALAWTDLYPPGGGQIAYAVRGTAPNRRLVVTFTDISWCCEIGVPRLATQLILRERKGVIEIHTTHQDPGHIYTQGVENSLGTVAAFLPGRVAADYGLDQDGVRFTTSAH